MDNLHRRIKQALSITEVLSHYNVTKGKRKNSYHCPIHATNGKERTNPSLIISDSKGIATCFSRRCFKGADIFTVIEKLEKCSKKEALYKAASLAGIMVEESNSNYHKNNSFQKNLKHDTEKTKRIIGLEELQKEHQSWLEERGIDFFVACRFGLKSKGEYIAFPHIKDGQITGWKLRSIYNKKSWQGGPEKGEIDLSTKLWNLEVWKEQRQTINHIIFVEGEPDCMLLAEKIMNKGNSNAAVLTCTTGAKSVPKDIGSLLSFFPKVKKFSIFYDRDDPGEEGSKILAESLKQFNRPIHIYSFPIEAKKGYDIGDFFHEKNSLSHLFALSVEIIAPYYDVNPAIDAFDFAYAESKAIKTGIPKFDSFSNGLEGLVILGGETGIGKTTFMLNLAYYAAENQHPVLYVSYEVGYTDLRVKLTAMQSKYTYDELRRNRQLFIEAREVLNTDPALNYLKVIDTRTLLHGANYIDKGIAALKREFPNSKTPLLIIDYLQGMPITSQGDYRLSLAASVQRLRDLVRQQNIVILTASATNTQRTGSSIHLGVFRETSEIEYSAYIALVLGYQDDQKEKGNVKPDQLKYPYLFVLKNRFGPKCTKGIPLEVDWEKQIYRERED